jgi:hypothetical protein
MPLSRRLDMPPFITDENGHIPMSDGVSDWLVIVTREALEDVAGQEDISTAWLSRNVDMFGEVASHKLELGRAGEEATVWVQSEDIREWRDATA